MYGLDISIVDIISVKGISNCIVNFEYGNFESSQFNARNSLTGGVFSVIDVGHETISLEDFLRGELVATVISVKKGFDVLCDGKCSVDLTSGKESSACRSDRVLPHLFRLKGFSTVSLDLFYRNKGPVRIKAGNISVELRFYELIGTAPASSPCTDLENSKIEEDPPSKLTEIYLPPESDSDCGLDEIDNDDDRSITDFMAQFKPINKAVSTDGRRGADGPRLSVDSHSHPRASTSSLRSVNRNRPSTGDSISNNRKSSGSNSSGVARSRPAWNEDVHFEPAPTDMTKIKRVSSSGNDNKKSSNNNVGGVNRGTGVSGRTSTNRNSRAVRVGHYSSML